MNCYFCNKATMSIPATGICTVCQSPSCSHPSGRPDFRFHGEKCRYPHCKAFLCKYDTHDHSGSGSGHGGGLPQNFPLLTVNISMPAMSVAESTFGHSKDAPLNLRATASLTEYVQFFTPIWYRRAILGRRPMFESLRGEPAGGRSEDRLIRSDYFDSLRVAQLALNAAVMLFSAWRGLRVTEQYSLGLPEEVIMRIEEFSSGELPQLAELSPRLDAFVTEALSLRTTLRAGKIEALDFRIRQMNFTPSARLLDMPAVLNLADRVRVRGSSEREGGADMSA
jgi:hypothetical protein